MSQEKKLVLLEPIRCTREELKSELRSHGAVVAVPKVHEALVAINRMQPDIVVCAFELGDSSGLHGLSFCELVRGSSGGKERTIVAYGVPDGKHPSAAKQEQLAKDFQLDLYIGEELTARALAERIGYLLTANAAAVERDSKRHKQAPSTAVVEHFESADSGTISTRDLLGTDAVVTARVATVSEEDSDEEETWTELLKQDVGVDSLRKLLSREVGFKSVEEFADEANPTWSELLRSRVNIGTLKRVVAKAGKPINFDRD